MLQPGESLWDRLSSTVWFWAVIFSLSLILGRMETRAPSQLGSTCTASGLCAAAL